MARKIRAKSSPANIRRRISTRSGSIRGYRRSHRRRRAVRTGQSPDHVAEVFSESHAADLKRIKNRFVFQEAESATRSSNLAKTSTAQSTNTRTLAFRCRLGGYMTWIG